MLKHSKESEEIITRLEKKMDVLEAIFNQLPNGHEGQVSSEDSHSNPNIKGNIEIKDSNESKTANQINCDICQKIFMSKDNLQTHDKKIHMKRIANKGFIYKCDQCNFTSIKKSEIHIHINEKHKKCDMCKRIFTNTKTIETHVKAIHKNELLKHTLER